MKIRREFTWNKTMGTEQVGKEEGQLQVKAGHQKG